MKALKILVFTLGGLLIIGFGVLIWGISTRVHVKAPPAPVDQNAFVQALPFGTVKVDLPPGAKVDGVIAAGSRVVVRTGQKGAERLIVLDPVAGKVQGEFVLAPPSPNTP